MPHKQTSYSKRDICFDVKNNLLFKNIVEGARLGIEVHQKNRLQFEHKTTKELDEKSTDFDLTYYPTDQTLFSQEFYSLKIFKIKNYHLQQTHDLTITAHSKFVYVPSIKTCFIANNKYHPEYYELQAYKLPENKLEESLIISQESLHVSHMVYDTKNHILITFIDTMSLADFHPKARIIGYTWSNNTLSQIFDQTDSRVPHLGGVQASEVLYVPSCNCCWVVWRSNMTCSQLVCYEYKIDKKQLINKKGHRIKLSSSPDHVLLHYNNPKKLLFLAESYWDRLVENLPPQRYHI